MMRALILYGTEGCHLCDDAQLLLRQNGISWRNVDIVDADSLMERYGTRIPVLATEDGMFELDWPFQAEEVLRLANQGIS